MGVVPPFDSRDVETFESGVTVHVYPICGHYLGCLHALRARSAHTGSFGPPLRPRSANR